MQDLLASCCRQIDGTEGLIHRRDNYRLTGQHTGRQDGWIDWRDGKDPWENISLFYRIT